MKSWSILAFFGAAALGLMIGGCGKVESTAGSDGGADSDVDGDSDGDGDHDTDPIPGGGTGGGPIAGRLTVHTFDEPSAKPIAGAKVMVGSDPATALVGESDAAGLTAFEDDALSGAVDLHILAKDYPAVSFLGVNAKVLTVELEPADHEDPEPKTAILSGTVGGLDLLPEPTGPTEYRMAFVGFGIPVEDQLSGEFELIEQEETDSLAPNAVAEGIKDTFSYEVHARKGTVYVVGGVYYTIQKAFVASRYSVIPGFDPTVEKTEEMELTLDEELTESFEIKVDPAPLEFGLFSAYIMFDLGEDGSVAFGAIPQPAAENLTIYLPDLSSDPFAGADTSLSVQARQEEDPEEIEANEFPTGSVLDWDFVVDLESSPLLVDTLSVPLTGLGWNNGIDFDKPSGATYISIHAETEDEVNIWGATSFDSNLDHISLPPFPKGWNWEGMPDSFEVHALQGVIDGDMNDIAFTDIVLHANSFTESFLLVD